MSKHPVMYHLTVRQLSLSALHLSRPVGYRPGYFVTHRHWYRIMLLLCSLQLMHSFTTLQGRQNTWFAGSTASPNPSNRSNTTTLAAAGSREKFSFEYDGLLQFKLVITENTGTGLIPAIHIVTTLNQPNR